jgi:hypothetical protein
MTKIEKIHRKMNDDFRNHLKDAMAEKGVAVESEWNFIIGNLVTKTVDGKDMTPEQMEYLKGFSDGYAKAMSQVYAS